KPTIKPKLAAIRMLYDFLVIRQLVPHNPTTSVRGPKYVIKRGKTPVWSREDAKKLLEPIPRDNLAGLRDRALISTMLFSFARIRTLVLPELVRSCLSNGKISITRDSGADSCFMRKAAKSMKCQHTTSWRKVAIST